MIKIQSTIIRVSQIAHISKLEVDNADTPYLLHVGTTGGLLEFRYPFQKERDLDFDSVKSTLDEGYGDALA